MGLVNMQIKTADSDIVNMFMILKIKTLNVDHVKKVFNAKSECLKHPRQEHINRVPLYKNETNECVTSTQIAGLFMKTQRKLMMMKTVKN